MIGRVQQTIEHDTLVSFRTAAELMDAIAKACAALGVEYKDAKVEFETDSDYDSHGGYVSLTVSREETAAEHALRQSRALQQQLRNASSAAAAEEMNARAEYARLKARFEG